MSKKVSAFKFNKPTLLITLAGLLLLTNIGHGATAAYITADIIDMNTNATVSGSIDSGTILANSGYHLIPYYLRINYPPNNLTAWGVQAYTNNNPNNSWTVGNGVYGGLRGLADRTQGLPLYWQVYDTPQSNTITAGGLGFYPATAHYWGLMEDSSNVNVASTWMLQENLARRTVVNYNGLGSYPLAGRTGSFEPVYMYLGVDASDVSQAQQFGTTLHLDLYHLGVDPNSGGYATPNPFTPTTGQRTNFNFFLQDLNASFSIRIFTIRGRLIKTITDRMDWDGRNENGSIVEGGLYIYQIETEGRRVSGTVVLIK